MVKQWLAVVVLGGAVAGAQTVTGWTMQDAARVQASGAEVSAAGFRAEGWYRATVPGTVLTTLVENGVYPEPLYGDNMRAIPESLNKTDWWYRATFLPAAVGRRTWLHFAGVNFSAEVWVNGQKAGEMRGAFVRGDFDVTAMVRPGRRAVVAVRVSPQPHPGVPHEHTQAAGVGKNGGETAIDGPTFLSTIGWDWLPAVRDRDTGIWLPVTVESTGPVVVKDPVVRTELAEDFKSAELTVGATLENASGRAVAGLVVGTVTGPAGFRMRFEKRVTVAAGASEELTVPPQHVAEAKLWWPNGYGPQNLYRLRLEFVAAGRVSSAEETAFGIRKIAYQVADSENLTISVNGVRVMVRGGNWGLDEAMKRIPKDRLEAQFHLHALANLNMIRNWVGQSTEPEFYEMADKYGMLLWDEFFQPNPSDGPNVTDIPTYLANVADKVTRYRNHPAVAVWCARNEGYPPKELDEQLKALVGRLDPTRLFQSNSADGRGVSSGGPYYWREPREFYKVKESFKTETGSMSVPTLESVQGMMPEKDWETINDDWAQHDMAKGAQRGDSFPETLAKRYGPVRNLADFVRKGQLATYEAFRAMYEGRNAGMFKTTSGVMTWMSNPAQPSFVWQLYHYDLEPNAALFAAKKAAETVHVQLNEENGQVEVVNNSPNALVGVHVVETTYRSDSTVDREQVMPVGPVAGSSVMDVGELERVPRVQGVYFVKLDLVGTEGQPLSTNFYWQSSKVDELAGLEGMATAQIVATAGVSVEGANTVVTVRMKNPTETIALMTHLQLRRKATGERVLPAFASDNYVTLTPGEERTVRVECATKDLKGERPLVVVDGFNVGVKDGGGTGTVRLNGNAQVGSWPESGIVSGR